MKRNLLGLGLTAAIRAAALFTRPTPLLLSLAAAFILTLAAGWETISLRDTRRELAP